MRGGVIVEEAGYSRNYASVLITDRNVFISSIVLYR